MKTALIWEQRFTHPKLRSKTHFIAWTVLTIMTLTQTFFWLLGIGILLGFCVNYILHRLTIQSCYMCEYLHTYCPVDIKIFRIASITAHAQLRRATGKKKRKINTVDLVLDITHWFTTGLASSHPSDKSLIFKNGGCVWHCLRPLPLTRCCQRTARYFGSKK